MKTSTNKSINKNFKNIKFTVEELITQYFSSILPLSPMHSNLNLKIQGSNTKN